MAKGAVDHDLHNQRGGLPEVVQQLVAAGDILQVDDGVLAEEDLLHIGKIGELPDGFFNPLKLGVQLGLDILGEGLEGFGKLALGEPVGEYKGDGGQDCHKGEHHGQKDLKHPLGGKLPQFFPHINPSIINLFPAVSIPEKGGEEKRQN